MTHGGWEAYVPWLFVAVGLIAAVPIAKILRRPEGSLGVGSFLGSVFLAGLLGVVLTFATVFANTYCIQTLKACSDHGDGNIGYWFHSFFAIPAFWAVMLFSAI